MTNPEKVAVFNQDSGYLMVDIANAFKTQGIQTSLIAGRIVERDIKLDKEIRIKKIIRYQRTSGFKRLFTWCIATHQLFFLMLFKFRKEHLLIVSNPPFATILPFFFKRKFSLLIFDVYPDALYEYGFFEKNSFIIRLWSRLNKKVYSRADYIFTLTRGMKKSISQYIEEERIKLVPLWTSNSFLKPLSKDSNPFITDHNLQGRFVVLYSGNFGLAHYVDKIIDLASLVKKESVHFVIIGGGPAENELKKKLKKLELKNCLILPWQEVKILPYSLAAADLSIVSLGGDAANIAIPSKLFNYLAVGSPILGITSRNSELDNLIKEYRVGETFEVHQLNDMASYIERMISDKKLYQEYSDKALQAAGYHTVKNVNLIVENYV